MRNYKNRIIADEQIKNQWESIGQELVNPFNTSMSSIVILDHQNKDQQSQILDNVRSVQLRVLRKRLTEFIEIFKNSEQEICKKALNVLAVSSHEYCQQVYKKLEKDQSLQTIKIVARQKISQVINQDVDEQIEDQKNKIYIIDSDSERKSEGKIVKLQINNKSEENIQEIPDKKLRKVNMVQRSSKIYENEFQYQSYTSSQKVELIEKIFFKNKNTDESCIPQRLIEDKKIYSSLLNAKTQTILKGLQKDFLQKNSASQSKQNQYRGQMNVGLSKVLFGGYYDIYNLDEFDRYLFGYLFFKGMLDNKQENVKMSILDEYWKDLINEVGLNECCPITIFIKSIREKYIKIVDLYEDISSTERIFEQIQQNGELVICIV